MAFVFQHDVPAALLGMGALLGGRSQGTAAQLANEQARGMQLAGIGANSVSSGLNNALNFGYQRANQTQQQNYQTQRDATQNQYQTTRDANQSTLDLDRQLIEKHGFGLTDIEGYQAKNPGVSFGDAFAALQERRDNAAIAGEINRGLQFEETVGAAKAGNRYAAYHGGQPYGLAPPPPGMEYQFSPADKARMNELRNYTSTVAADPSYTPAEKALIQGEVQKSMQAIKPQLVDAPKMPTIDDKIAAGQVKVANPGDWAMTIDPKTGEVKLRPVPKKTEDDPLKGFKEEPVIRRAENSETANELARQASQKVLVKYAPAGITKDDWKKMLDSHPEWKSEAAQAADAAKQEYVDQQVEKARKDFLDSRSEARQSRTPAPPPASSSASAQPATGGAATDAPKFTAGQVEGALSFTKRLAAEMKAKGWTSIESIPDAATRDQAMKAKEILEWAKQNAKQ